MSNFLKTISILHSSVKLRNFFGDMSISYTLKAFSAIATLPLSYNSNWLHKDKVVCVDSLHLNACDHSLSCN